MKKEKRKESKKNKRTKKNAREFGKKLRYLYNTLFYDRNEVGARVFINTDI